MTPTNFPEATQLLGRPSDMNDEECGALPICRGTLGGFPVVVSQWMPSDEERAAIAAGAPVVLHVIGSTQPPVLLSTSIECDAPTVGSN